jgi:CMP-N-acetylneuraminic acid synthetase
MMETMYDGVMIRMLAIVAVLLLSGSSCLRRAGQPAAQPIDDAKVIDMAMHYQQMAESYEEMIALLQAVSDERTAREARPKFVSLEEQ